MTPAIVWTERAIAVDPGKLTGLCAIERRRWDSGQDVVTILASAETGPDETVPVFREWYSQWHEPDPRGGPRLRVVCESFRITPQTGSKSQEASWALRTQGAIEQACRDLGYPPEAIQFYGPDKKKAFQNPRLKRLGLWHTGGQGHALDAIRHGVLYLSQTGLLPEVS